MTRKIRGYHNQIKASPLLQLQREIKVLLISYDLKRSEERIHKQNDDKVEAAEP